MEVLEIDPRWSAPLAGAGLVRFADFMREDIGEALHQGPGSAVSRLTCGGETFFLKRMPRQSLGNSLAILFSGRVPHGTAYREMQHCRALRDAGFAVMEVAAAGEERWLGLPGASFIVSRGLPGTELDRVFRAAEPPRKRRIARQFGKLLGGLHAAGFYGRVRLKDLIVHGGAEPEEWTYALIDRETRTPTARPFSRRRAVLALAATAARHRQIGFPLDPPEMRRFLRGYARAVAGRWPVSPRELWRLCRKSPALKVPVRSSAR